MRLYYVKYRDENGNARQSEPFKTFAGAFDKYVQILIATNNGDPKRLQTAYRNTKIRQVVK